MDSPTTSYKFVGTEPAHFNIGEKEHYLSHGKRAKLPSDDAYVKGLVASGQLVEVAQNATNDTDNVANVGPADAAKTDTADNAPAGSRKSAR